MADDDVLDILRSIFALVKRVPDRPPEYLGTAFFIDQDGTFLTARHVVSGHADIVGVSLKHHPGPEERPIATALEDIKLGSDIDLARGRADIPDRQAIRLADTEPAAGGDVLTAEFSRSTQVEPGKGLGLHNPSVHKGHIVRAFGTEEPPFQRRTQVYELSFPALLGASGAPVVDLDNLSVVGLIVANVATHLIPAQVERIEGGEGEAETIHYYLPHAQAIAYSEFAAIL